MTPKKQELEVLVAVEPFLFHLIGENISDLPAITSKIKSQLNVDQSLEKHIYYRKFTNINDIKGLLDYLSQKTRIYQYPKITLELLKQLKPDFVIGPLNMDELYFFYKLVLGFNIPVYPLTDALLNSKFIRNVLFRPFIPISVYVPQACFKNIPEIDLESYFKAKGIDRVIIKDEFGFHSGENIEYQILPIEGLKEKLSPIIKKASRVDNVGGLIIEAFEIGKESSVYKTHIFGELIPNEVLKYNVRLSGLEGIFKSHLESTPQLLESVETSIGTIPEEIRKKLNPLIHKYMPYSFSSFDFLIIDGNPKIIDVNSKAGSLGQLQEMRKNNEYNPFKFFLDKIDTFGSLESQNQAIYLQKLRNLAEWKMAIETIVGCDNEDLIDLQNSERLDFSFE